MAEMGWTARVAAAAGAAAGAGAAQLGLGYGLGVVVWPAADTADDGVWLGSLGWATWISASATVLGAVVASRHGDGPALHLPAASAHPPGSATARDLDSGPGTVGFGRGGTGGPGLADGGASPAAGASSGRPRGHQASGSTDRPGPAGPGVRGAGGPRRPLSGNQLAGPWRLALAAAAATGSLLTVVLVALPARTAVRADTFSPHLIAAGYALLGVLLGLIVAYWAVVSRAVAANLIATAGWLWTLAISAVVVDLALHRPSATYLASWQFAGGAGHRHGTIFWPSAALTLAAAFVIGLLAVVPAARRGQHGTGAATSGAVGPLLVAIAFFALAPHLTGALGSLESAYLIAPYAVLSGLAGSAATVAFATSVAARRAARSAPGAPPPAERDRGRIPGGDDARATRSVRDIPPTAGARDRIPGGGDARATRSAAGAPPAADPDRGRIPGGDDARRGGARGTDRSDSQSGRDEGTGDVATIPAADPATFPAGPPPKRRFFWGRRQSKLSAEASPDQPSTGGNVPGAGSAAPAPEARPAGGDTPPAPTTPAPSASAIPTQTARSEPAPPGSTAGPAASPGARTSRAKTPPAKATPAQATPAPVTPAPVTPPPTAPPPQPVPTEANPSRVNPTPVNPARSQPTQPKPAQPKPAQPATAQPKPARPRPTQAAPARATPAKSTPAQAVPPPATPAKATEQDHGDPEIAAARLRGRARKAAPPANPPRSGEDNKPPHSSVTPPPTSPRIAQINPEPPPD